MTSYALFLGCTIPARQPKYELSARKALTKLGVDLVDLANMTCCCPPPIQSIDMVTSLAVAANNISIAEAADLDILTLCSGCFESLAMANTLLREDNKLKTKINDILSKAGNEFRGSIQVKHLVQVLKEDIGFEHLKQSVTKPLNNLKVAAFYGCHALRPSNLLKLDDPERPRILENLIEALGAENVVYRNKLKCCGGLLRGSSDELALDLAREKVLNATKAGADCISTLCPFCFVALDIGQVQMNRKFEGTYDMPIIHYSELLAMALGVDPKSLSPEIHRIKLDKVLSKIM